MYALKEPLSSNATPSSTCGASRFEIRLGQEAQNLDQQLIREILDLHAYGFAMAILVYCYFPIVSLGMVQNKTTHRGMQKIEDADTDIC